MLLPKFFRLRLLLQLARPIHPSDMKLHHQIAIRDSGVLAHSIAQPDIDAGELKELDIDGGGPAAQLLAKLLKEAAKNNQSGRM